MEGPSDKEDARMMLESATEDKIKMTGLETRGHHLTDEFINIFLGLSLAPGGRSQIT